MNIKVLSKTNKDAKTVKLPEEVISAKNNSVISEYINFVRSAMRSPIANTKDRSEVSGGGKKPWRQKGTGRARHGSSRSPLWVGGGVTFGPSAERNFWLNHPKKFRKYARFAILNQFAENNNIVIIEDLLNNITKTKNAEALLEEMGIEGKISIIFSEEELGQAMAYRNLAYTTLMSKNHQNIVILASSDKVIFSQSGFKEYFDTSKIIKEQSETNN